MCTVCAVVCALKAKSSLWEITVTWEVVRVEMMNIRVRLTNFMRMLMVKWQPKWDGSTGQLSCIQKKDLRSCHHCQPLKKWYYQMNMAWLMLTLYLNNVMSICYMSPPKCRIRLQKEHYIVDGRSLKEVKKFHQPCLVLHSQWGSQKRRERIKRMKQVRKGKHLLMLQKQ